MFYWFPVVNSRVRRGRSASSFAYNRQAMGEPIRTSQNYAFSDSLLHQNIITQRLEDHDPAYRGEVSAEI